ncbi:copper-translocating P-type ATPase [Candidatus Woesebacteria bacterium]|nr:copper-translocating P-type ATPase [Candidatus Woesebacteria bacterium]
MHPDVTSETSKKCHLCGMDMVLNNESVDSGHHGNHNKHNMKKADEMNFWEKFKVGMTMSMGMEHGGIAGREMAKLMEEDVRNKFFFALALTMPIVAYSPLGEKILGISLPAPVPVSWILFILTTPVFFYSGWIFLYSTYKALQQKTLNMAVLIAVGITTAYFFSIVLTLLGSSDSYYEAASMLITFVLFGHWMEMKSRRGTTDALSSLFALIPPQARIWKDSKEIIIPTADVKVGDILLLKPGDKVPVDGEVAEGETSIDESLVTGESIPVLKKKKDKVIGGSINLTGSIKFRATKIGGDTVLSQIVNLVEIAQNSKAPGQKIADRFAQYLVIVAVGGGLLTFLFWFFIAGQPILFALTFAISTVVIACPDALGLATPTAVAVGTGLGAKHNILIKDAPTLEQTSKINAIVLDKTGTLTEGKPKITEIITLNGFGEDQALRLMGATEAKSNHPLSMAVLDEARRRKIKLSGSVKKFQNLSGLGVTAIVLGREILCGTLKLMKENRIDTKVVNEYVEKFSKRGETVMILAVDKKTVAVIGASDPVKPTSEEAVKKLHDLGIETAMITGDNVSTAEAVARRVGVKRVFAEVLPADKAKYVKKLQEEGKFVAMVGDGVNDAPALATADIGIAIGAGTDVAVETAKVVLMKSDPMDILRAILLSKATVTKMKQNLFWASIYNLLAIPVAAGVLYPSFGISLRPEVSALLMSISSIIVATNAVLLKGTEKSLLKA